MAFPSFLLVAALLGAYALYKYWDISRRHRIPKGLKPLPGPKGMTTSFTHYRQGPLIENVGP